MVRADLVDYIKQYVNQGYNLEVIKNTLIQNGVAQNEIDEAVKFAMGGTMPPVVEHKITLPKSTIIGVAVILLVITGLTFGAIKIFGGEKEALLDVKLSSYPTTANPGEQLEFKRLILNMGGAKRVDVTVKYEIIDMKTREVVARMEETEAVETQSTSMPTIEVPEDSFAGNYLLQATAFYEDKEASASFNFKIETGEEVKPVETPIITQPTEEPEILMPDGCTEICDDYDICTLDKCVEGECIFDDIVPCCGNLKCEDGESEEECPEDCLVILGRGEALAEIQRQAEELASTDLIRSTKLCRTIQDSYKSDQCLLEIAKKSKKHMICGQIFEKGTKDKCYMDFAIQEEKFDLCDKIYDRWLKQSCKSYAKISQIEIPEQEG